MGERPSTSLAQALASVRLACETGDPRAARAALLAWGLARWRDDPPARLETLAERLAAYRGVAGGGEAASSLRLLDQSLYAPGVMTWDGPNAWRYLQPVLGALGSEVRSGRTGSDPLPDLYPKAG